MDGWQRKRHRGCPVPRSSHFNGGLNGCPHELMCYCSERGARQHHRMLPSRSCIQTSGRRFQSRSTSVGSPHRPPSTPSEASLGSDFAIRRRHPACGWGQAISASRGTSRHSAPIARGTLRIRENPTNCKGPIQLAFDETRHQDHDRQMRGLPAAEAEQTRQTSHHDIGQLPYGANLHRSVSR